MATTSNPPASGSITLVDFSHESASGHYDKSRSVQLVPADGEDIELVEFMDECDQFKGPRTESCSKWRIDREKLIEIVKANGQKTA